MGVRHDLIIGLVKKSNGEHGEFVLWMSSDGEEAELIDYTSVIYSSVEDDCFTVGSNAAVSYQLAEKMLS